MWVKVRGEIGLHGVFCCSRVSDHFAHLEEWKTREGVPFLCHCSLFSLCGRRKPDPTLTVQASLASESLKEFIQSGERRQEALSRVISNTAERES